MKHRCSYPIILFCATLLFFGILAALYHLDNKYTYPSAHTVSNGVMLLNTEAFERKPLLFLIDGWELYRYKLLTPDDIPTHTPDAVVFIGQYGGFELGDKTANPHGEATYRLTVLTGEAERDYALEVPEIFSACRVYINGNLKYETGFGAEEHNAQTAHTMLVFQASGPVEIVVAVRDDSHFYSGMVYPPSFGAPGAVLRTLSERLLVHTAACGIAAVIALLCLFFGYRRRGGEAGTLAALCLCFIACAAYPVLRMLGLHGEIWYDMEWLGAYGMIAALIWLQGRLCRMSRRVWLSLFALGVGICLAIPVYRHFLMNDAKGMYIFSDILSAWKWLSAIYLITMTLWAAVRGRDHAKSLLCGISIYAAALVADRLMPWFEPIVTGWFSEVAGFALLLIVLGILCYDSWSTYRESSILKERSRSDAMRLAVYREQEAMQKQYIEKTGMIAHRIRGSALALQAYLETGDYDNLAAVLGRILDGGSGGAQQRTGNALLDGALGYLSTRTSALGIEPEIICTQVPADLSIDDVDLAALLINLIDNALEASERLPDQGHRSIELCIRYEKGIFIVQCKNRYSGKITKRGSRYVSTKQDGGMHGYGLKTVSDIIDLHSGVLEITYEGGIFSVYAGMNLGVNPVLDKCRA